MQTLTAQQILTAIVNWQPKVTIARGSINCFYLMQPNTNTYVLYWQSKTGLVVRHFKYKSCLQRFAKHVLLPNI